MSIYATRWAIKIPVNGCWAMNDAEWIEVVCQVVPAHIGHPSHYPEGDPYADHLPPVVDYEPWTVCTPRAVFFVDGKTTKHIQEYINPVLMLTGHEFETIGFEELFDRLTSAIEQRWGRDGEQE